MRQLLAVIVRLLKVQEPTPRKETLQSNLKSSPFWRGEPDFGPAYERVYALAFTLLNAIEASSFNDFCYTFLTFPLLDVSNGCCRYVLILRFYGSWQSSDFL